MKKMEKKKKLPLFTRHDGNIGSLEDCGFYSILNDLTNEYIAPIIAEIFLNDNNSNNKIKCRHAFVTKNWVGRNETFRKHRDKSDFTLNVCIGKSKDVKGSTVSFFQDYDGFIPPADPKEHPELFVYDHNIGYAVLHTGKQWHKTNEIDAGQRSSLIIWFDQL